MPKKCIMPVVVGFICNKLLCLGYEGFSSCLQTGMKLNGKSHLFMFITNIMLNLPITVKCIPTSVNYLISFLVYWQGEDLTQNFPRCTTLYTYVGPPTLGALADRAIKVYGFTLLSVNPTWIFLNNQLVGKAQRCTAFILAICSYNWTLKASNNWDTFQSLVKEYNHIYKYTGCMNNAYWNMDLHIGHPQVTGTTLLMTL